MTKTDFKDFSKRLKSMLKVDTRRMFRTPLVYIMFGICLLIPVLILVMTSFMGTTTTVTPTGSTEQTMEGFKNVWQIVGSTSGSAMSMDLTSMCNINLVFFVAAIFVCIFVSEDFRSGYVKNLFTIRSKRMDYVVSKTISCFIASVVMLLLFFVGGLIGGAIAGLPFAMDGFNAGTIACCLLSKIFILLIFIALPLTFACLSKQRLWLSVLCTLGAGMLLFMTIPLMTPLNAGLINVVMCLAGGALFAVGLSFVSRLILNKTSLV